jgi:hypothetical protein
MGEIGPFGESRDEQGEVVREPEVVVTEIGDQPSSRLAKAFVVRAGLVAGVLGKVDPAKARIVDRRHDGLRVVRAPVSNDEDLEVPERLTERAFHRERQDRAPVVGGDDDGDERRRGGPTAIRETMGSRVARGCGHLASSARLVSDGARDDGTLQGVIEG